KVLAALSRVLMIGGDSSSAADIAAEALALVPETSGRGAVLDRVQLLNTYGCATWALGDEENGRSAVLESLRLAREHDDHAGAIRAYVNLGVNDKAAGGPGARYIEQGLALAREQGLRPMEARLLAIGATLQLHAGDLDAAMEGIEAAETVLREVGPDAASTLETRMGRAVRFLALGELDAAMTAFTAMLPDVEQTGDRHDRGWVRWGLGWTLLLSGDAEGAATVLDPLAGNVSHWDCDWRASWYVRVLAAAAARGDVDTAGEIADAVFQA